MNERETDALDLRGAFPDVPQDCRDALLRAARSAEEEQKMRIKKTPVRVVVIAALILVLTMTAAAAAALGLNPFAWFSDRRPEYRDIADHAAIAPADPVVWTDERAGSVAVTCEYAYYDGSSLLLGCTVTNDIYVEDYVPTDAELRAMQRMERNLLPMAETEQEQRMLLRLGQARQNGESLGWAVYQVYFADHSDSLTGIDLGRSGGEEERLDGALIAIRDYWELPAEMWNQKEITVRVPIRQSVQRYYFDGETLYHRMEGTELAPLIVTVPCTDAALRRFTGETAIRGVPARVSIMATAVRLFATVDFAEEMPRPEEDAIWCDLALYDENGDMLTTDSCRWQSDSRVFFTVNGTGQVPEALEGSFVVGVPMPSGEDQTEEYPLHMEAEQ